MENKNEEETKNIEVDNYGEMIGLVNNWECLFYTEYGNYGGEYLAIFLERKKIIIYIGYFGSCCGCDFLEAEADETRYGENKKKYSIKYLKALNYVQKESGKEYMMPLNLFTKISISDLNLYIYTEDLKESDRQEIDKILQDKINNKK